MNTCIGLNAHEETHKLTGQSQLSLAFDKLEKIANDGPVEIGSILYELGNKSHEIICFIFIVPFLQPIPLAGLSTFIGIFIAAIGVYIAQNKPIWLPGRCNLVKVQPRILRGIVKGGRLLQAKTKNFYKPRCLSLMRNRATKVVAGVMIFIAAILLSLPLPIPFSNSVPAYTILLLSLALMEDDGVLFLLGSLSFVGTLIFFVALIALPKFGIDAIYSYL